jgi:nicotinamidase-related amidase
MKEKIIVDADTPLIVVDVQNGFVTPHSRHVVPVIRDLLEEWIRDGRPVFMTRFINTPGSSWQSLIGWRRLQGEPETSLHPSLQSLSLSTTIVDKTTYTSVTGPIEQYLRRGQPSTVAICGISTDGCVLKTALDVFDMGLRPLVVADACASHAGADIHDAAIMILSRQLGRGQIIKRREIRSRSAA